MLKKTLPLVQCTILVFIVLAGCTQPVSTVDPVLPENLEVDAHSLILTGNETWKLNATILPTNSDDTTIHWRSSNESVATVNAAGEITARSTGTTDITVTATANDSLSLTIPVRVGYEQPQSETIRTLSSEDWNLKSMSYSGYRRQQRPGTAYPSLEEIDEDMVLLTSAGFGLLRLYDTGTHAERTLKVIDDGNYDIKIQLGVYIDGKLTREHNFGLLDDAIALVEQYPDIITAVSVGNETLVSWSFVKVLPTDMIQYIRYIRDAIELPITVNDDNTAIGNQGGFINFTNRNVWRELDYISMHTYAYWDAIYGQWDIRFPEVAETERAQAMMDYAFEYTRNDFNGVRNALDSINLDYLPIVIGETGWQSFPAGRADGNPSNAVVNAADFMAHPVNQAMYYDAMMEWTFGENGDDRGDGFSRPASMFYFEAFDEPWKGGDDHWGLWNVDREEKWLLSRDAEFSIEDAVYYSNP